MQGNEHVRGLDVAVNDALLVGMLNRLADGDEQIEAFLGCEAVAIAVLGDRDALDQLHHEEWPAGVGGTRIQNASDVGVVHDGQGLAFGLEPGDDLSGIHAGLDDLEGDLAPDRVLLLGHEDRAHAPLADFLEQLVRADLGSRSFGDGLVGSGA